MTNVYGLHKFNLCSALPSWAAIWTAVNICAILEHNSTPIDNIDKCLDSLSLKRAANEVKDHGLNNGSRLSDIVLASASFALAPFSSIMFVHRNVSSNNCVPPFWVELSWTVHLVFVKIFYEQIRKKKIFLLRLGPLFAMISLNIATRQLSTYNVIRLEHTLDYGKVLLTISSMCKESLL